LGSLTGNQQMDSTSAQPLHGVRVIDFR
jgi:hypothetical protein